MIKKFMIFAMCFILAAVSAGCGGEKQANDRKSKNEIVISVGKYFINGGYDPTAGWGIWASDPFHSALLTHDKENHLVNDLASDMKVSADGLRYTFTLREDVKFSDGKPLTAEAVAFTFNTAKKAAGAVDLSYMDSAKAMDATHVEILLKKPWAVFPETVASLGIVAPHAYGEDYGSKPVGAGPWKLVSFQKEQQMVLEPNEYYYGAKPKLKKVTVINVGSDAALAAAQSGQVDLIFVPAEFAKHQIKGMKNVNVPSTDVFAINFPMEPEHEEDGMMVGNNVTSDPAIRQALNIGISRKEIIQNALNGFGTPAFNFSRHLPWVNEEMTMQDGQVEKAKAVLEEAGWKDTDGDGVREKNGVKAEFTINGRANDPDRYHTAVALAAEAKKLGIHIHAVSKAWSEARKIARHVPTTWGFGTISPEIFYNHHHSSQIGVNVINNSAMYHNPTVDAYIEDAMRATSQDELHRLIKKAQWDGTTGASKDVPYLWLVESQMNYFVNEDLEVGKTLAKPRGQGMGILYNLTEWQWRQ